ncbi:hypothetical protein Gotur_027457 [Gossypium turneri]
MGTDKEDTAVFLDRAS